MQPNPERSPDDPGHVRVVIDRVTMLINPHAGRGRALHSGKLAARVLSDRGIDVRPIVTRDAAHLADGAARCVADGGGVLVVCGGDGAVHGALQAVAGTKMTLGVIPAGSGNDFARSLGLPLSDPAAAARVVADGLTARVDLGRAGERWFGTVLAAGFDSRVNDRMNRMSWPRGRTRYHAAIVAEMAAFRALPFMLEVEGSRRDVEAMLVAVGNGSSYGGGMRICPRADLDDGLFDVTVVHRIGRIKLARLFPTVYPGTHVDRPEVSTFRCRSLTVSAPGVAAYADGERVAALPVTCVVEPGAVRVLVPDAAAGERAVFDGKDS